MYLCAVGALDVYASWKELTAVLRPQYEEREAQQVARWLVEDTYGLRPLYAGKKVEVSQTTRALLRRRLRRLISGEPIQYVLGYTYFLGRKFHLRPQVLIPRPETEELTERALRVLQGLNRPKVLDIGTGSGCIAISLALSGAEAVGIDVSQAALRCARRNAKALGARLQLQHQDILQPIREDRSYDMLVSNPPYVPNQERAQLRTQVRDWEPEEALFVPDKEPLLFYKAIATAALRILKAGGRIFLEAHEKQGTAVVRLLRNIGCQQVLLHEDLSCRSRIVEAILLKEE